MRIYGYFVLEGLNFGIDYFVLDDDIIVIEINVWWMGGFFLV